MLKFKSFRAGTFSDEDVTSFINSHIVDQKGFLENGDVNFLYRDEDDMEFDRSSKLERIYRAIVAAQTTAYDAELGLIEVAGDLADTEQEIAKTNPNEKAKWDKLQELRKYSEQQKTMHEKTISGSERQVFDLKEVYKKIAG